MTDLVDVTDSAPSFALTDQDGARRTLEEFAGSKLVIFFYPAAMTPGCTTQACDFRDSMASLEAAGYGVVGISRDEPAKLREFADRDSLSFPLLSDPDASVHRAYGAWGEKNSYGTVSEGVLRSTFVVDEDGTIILAKRNVKATGHVARLRGELGIS